MKETIGAVIKAARTEGMGLTRVAFATRMSVADQTIYYWEVGKRHPRHNGFVRLLETVPPHFALRLLCAAGMRNPEAWALRLCTEIHSGWPTPEDVLGVKDEDDDC